MVYADWCDEQGVSERAKGLTAVLPVGIISPTNR